GLYLLISLILTIGGRVLPGFIERGVDYPVRIAHPTWIKVTSLALFIPFFVADVFLGQERLAGVLAVALAAVNLLRLARWHTIGIWRRPLLWGLYVAMLFIVAGFVLYALSVFAATPKLLAVHAFGLGGVGLATLAMMARVALGHTGRSVLAPPLTVSVALVLMLCAALTRVVVPMVLPGYYAASVTAAQLLWIAAFAVFLGRYWRVLTRPRVETL
ncbi:MAG: NnrS family protein, partial [Gammaproteobacteria bacterium]|nr:NnrS family protein [Gammaproteobacteria bacterium]